MSASTFQPRFPVCLRDLPLFHQGKTRDTFETKSPKHLLVVATDRISTHDVVHQSSIPEKGKVLTALTIFWAKLLEQHGIRHHVVASGRQIFDFLPGTSHDYPDDIFQRAIVVEKLRMIPVEFIFRAYLTGSLWKSYSRGEPNPYGIDLSKGLQLMSPFDPPIFTPTDKSDTDDPIDAERIMDRLPVPYAFCLQAFAITRERLRSAGIELVDTKFEVGFNRDGNTVLADEFITPDSSRFCPLSEIKEGEMPPWLDKQVARDVAERSWKNGEKAPLQFSPCAVSQLRETYLEICERITGKGADEFFESLS